jgi:alpha-ketoglutarate-dependent taurine dioxygenase
MRTTCFAISPSRVSLYSNQSEFTLTDAVSQRGVVFFRKQDDLTNDLQKVLIQRLGELTGKPVTSGLHIHPILNSDRELGGSDPEISTISSEQNKKFYKNTPYDISRRIQSSVTWHSDIAFEPVPADYTSLRLVKLPRTGGGEWCSLTGKNASC